MLSACRLENSQDRISCLYFPPSLLQIDQNKKVWGPKASERKATRTHLATFVVNSALKIRDSRMSHYNMTLCWWFAWMTDNTPPQTLDEAEQTSHVCRTSSTSSSLLQYVRVWLWVSTMLLMVAVLFWTLERVIQLVISKSSITFHGHHIGICWVVLL